MLNTLFKGYDACNKENDMKRKIYTSAFQIIALQLMGENSKPILQLAVVVQ